ncbi:hypothetical protein MPH_05143 [Macrophomina phaseolina MS6]|uniref:Uncharacterized protein n=1 Tax=Macrophomina phaseolina (strain MS6) TaxID=1126212 RepID=K2S573_MACPH|nr:hypothetical protein MPH_05143 [Macrophomina phaseolina MS6]
MSLNHVGIAAPPAKYDAVVVFYPSALGLLNYTAILSLPEYIEKGSAETKVADFWTGKKDTAVARQESQTTCPAKGEYPVHFGYSHHLGSFFFLCSYLHGAIL